MLSFVSYPMRACACAYSLSPCFVCTLACSSMLAFTPPYYTTLAPLSRLCLLPGLVSLFCSVPYREHTRSSLCMHGAQCNNPLGRTNCAFGRRTTTMHLLCGRIMHLWGDLLQLFVDLGGQLSNYDKQLRIQRVVLQGTDQTLVGVRMPEAVLGPLVRKLKEKQAVDEEAARVAGSQATAAVSAFSSFSSSSSSSSSSLGPGSVEVDLTGPSPLLALRGSPALGTQTVVAIKPTVIEPVTPLDLKCKKKFYVPAPSVKSMWSRVSASAAASTSSSSSPTHTPFSSASVASSLAPFLSKTFSSFGSSSSASQPSSGMPYATSSSMAALTKQKQGSTNGKRKPAASEPGLSLFHFMGKKQKEM